METNQDANLEISLKDILQVIKKNLIFIIVISLIASCGAFFVTKFFITKTYTSSVKLYVETTYDTSSSYENLQSYTYAEKLVQTYMQMLDTNSFYSDVAQELEDKYTASQLNHMINFSAIEDTEVFEADVVTTNPTEAKQIADAVANVAPKTILNLNDKAELKIVDEPTIPTAPTSPNTTKNVLVAFMAGLVIALIISFVRDFLDVKVKYNKDMTTLCELPILAAIPDFAYYTDNSKKEAKSYEGY
jgi:capsular polysaccharide biosynthesis protein